MSDAGRLLGPEGPPSADTPCCASGNLHCRQERRWILLQRRLTTTTVTLTYCIKSSAALHAANGSTPGLRFLYLVRRDQYVVEFLQLWQTRQDLLAVVRL